MQEAPISETMYTLAEAILPEAHLASSSRVQLLRARRHCVRRPCVSTCRTCRTSTTTTSRTGSSTTTRRRANRGDGAQVAAPRCMQAQALNIATFRGFLLLEEIRPIVFSCQAVRRLIEPPFVWIEAALAHKESIREERRRIRRQHFGVPEDQWVDTTSNSSKSSYY